MRSIWIATSRSEDPEDKAVQDLYVFESSFDARKFVTGIKRSTELPESVTNLIWSVDEMPIQPNKTEALIDFYKIYKD
jgi:hypothetical protein